MTSITDALKLGTDPYFHRALPLDELVGERAAGDRARARGAGIRTKPRSASSRKNRANGASGAIPDRARGPARAIWIAVRQAAAMAAHRHDGVARRRIGLVALVLADESFVREHGLGAVVLDPWHGLGDGAGFLGDRKLAELPSLAAAAKQAYRSAGVNDARSAFQVAEISDATPYQELLAYEGLGLCARDEWSARIETALRGAGTLPVNPSGGALSFNPVYCAGLVRIAEAANQVRGRAGNHSAKTCGARLRTRRADPRCSTTRSW